MFLLHILSHDVFPSPSGGSWLGRLHTVSAQIHSDLHVEPKNRGQIYYYYDIYTFTAVVSWVYYLIKTIRMTFYGFTAHVREWSSLYGRWFKMSHIKCSDLLVAFILKKKEKKKKKIHPCLSQSNQMFCSDVVTARHTFTCGKGCTDSWNVEKQAVLCYTTIYWI